LNYNYDFPSKLLPLNLAKSNKRSTYSFAFMLARMRLGTLGTIYLDSEEGFRKDSCFQNSVQLLQRTLSAPVYLTVKNHEHWSTFPKL